MRSKGSIIRSSSEFQAILKQQLTLMRDMCMLADAAVKQALGNTYEIFEHQTDDNLQQALLSAQTVGHGATVQTTEGFYDVTQRIWLSDDPALLHPNQYHQDLLRRFFRQLVSERERADAIDAVSRMPIKYSDADILLQGMYGWDMVLSKLIGVSGSTTLYNLAFSLSVGLQQKSPKLLAAYSLLGRVYGVFNQYVKGMFSFEEAFFDAGKAELNLELLTEQLKSVVMIKDDDAISSHFGKAAAQLAEMATKQQALTKRWSSGLTRAISAINKIAKDEFTQAIKQAIQQGHVLDEKQLKSMMRRWRVKSALRRVSFSQFGKKKILFRSLKNIVKEQLATLIATDEPAKVAQVYRIQRSLCLEEQRDGLTTQQSMHVHQQDKTITGALSSSCLSMMYRLQNQLAYYETSAGRRHINAARLERLHMLDAIASVFVSMYQSDELLQSDAEVLVSMVFDIQSQHQRDHSRWFNRTNRLGDAMQFALSGVKRLSASARLSADASVVLKQALSKYGISVPGINMGYHSQLIDRTPLDCCGLFSSDVSCFSRYDEPNAYQVLFRDRFSEKRSRSGSAASSTRSSRDSSQRSSRSGSILSGELSGDEHLRLRTFGKRRTDKVDNVFEDVGNVTLQQ